PYENYITPEQCVPEEPLDVPWESCITLGGSFSFAYGDRYKTPREVITLLTDIVAKGGNLALNVGPQPDGRLPAGALKSMEGFGRWLAKYGEAIYGTRICAPYKKDGICFTQKEAEGVVYAIKQYPEEGEPVLERVWIPFEREVKKIIDVYTGEPVGFCRKTGGYEVICPTREEGAIAQVFRLHLS
ncbi:MAG: alpha-L-fucosidase, partial [Parasporobacterium sp.]|nr:alpha-L-fucosidase [Parasporobacterium sp.]